MLRSMTIAMALGVMIFGMSSAEAAKYCAGYTGGAEKAEARSNWVFASLKACRASVRERGGGHCYRKSQLR